MSDKEFDILIIGATGYTGRLVVEYLSNHKLSPSLRIALGGRTLSKVKELTYDHDNFHPIHVDVNDDRSVWDAVQKTRVVINLAGPYRPRGSTVVRACALHGVHYVDLAGEPHWLVEIIEQYDYLAHRKGACIVPCCGFDSIPSDLACYLGMKSLEGKIFGSGVPRPLSITSVSSFRVKGGISGGTAASIFDLLESVPKEKRSVGRGWGLIPGPAGFSAAPRFLYTLPQLRPTIYGGFFPMSPVNEAIVRRSWGILERRRRESTPFPFPAPTFSYHEFLRMRGPISSIAFSLAFFLFGVSMALLPPVRWIAKRLMPKSGEGPSEEELKNGWLEVVNVTEAEGMSAKSVIKGDGDPGYGLTSVMVAECALLLLDTSKLTPLAREGGILTPTTAFGDELVKALEGTGKFHSSSELSIPEEQKKTR
ncbi:hypothetical protein FRC07_007678 [Ceratobasidium sp. 392]|nr:hypothetical protein FRC07_007678 [Ceratobasidium sp. 392]